MGKMSIKIEILMFIILFSLIFIIPTEFSYAEGDTNEAIGEFKDTINKIANILLAIAALSSVLIFIIHFLRLGAAHNHPMSRYRIMKDIMVSGIVTALIGAIGLVFKLYVGIFA